MKYELRKLTSEDIFPMTKIISEIGIKNIKTAFSSDLFEDENGNKKDDAAIGISLAFEIGDVILANLSLCKDSIYKFLANISGASVSELKKASMSDFAEIVIELVRKEEFKDFFGVVSKLFK